MTSDERRTDGPLVVGLGEALFDCFPDRQVLGGAPVNVVVHLDALLRPLGGHAVPATRVGDDELGRRFLAELTARGVDTDWVQIDADRPTGTVRVEPRADGETAYRFADDVAWDRLESTNAWRDLTCRCDAVVFGTLAQRCVESRVTIEAFVEAAPHALRLLDVNLRQDFYSRAILERSLQLASSAKVNQDELATVCRLLGVGEIEAGEALACESLAERYGLDWVAVTRGAAGASLFVDGERHDAPPAPLDPRPGADSVGAGDAFTAGLLTSMLRRWPWERSLAFANRLGAFVASRPGATPELPPSLIEEASQP